MTGIQSVIAAVVACGIAFLLHLSLDSGRYAEPTPRLFSLPLVGLALIFAARGWSLGRGRDPRLSAFFTGLAIGIGGYAIVRLFL
jgi:hypothetical protein